MPILNAKFWVLPFTFLFFKSICRKSSYFLYINKILIKKLKLGLEKKVNYPNGNPDMRVQNSD